MGIARWSIVSLLLMALAGGAASGQYWGPRRDDRDRTQPQQPQNPRTRPVITEGPSRAPEDKGPVPENAAPIPAPTETRIEPPVAQDEGFANALRTAWSGIVRINLDKNRKAIGFLIAGADNEHVIVVTNFLSLAGTKWIDIRQPDGSKLEVEGLLDYDEQQDLATLSAKTPDSRKTKVLELADKDPKEGHVVYAVGAVQWGQAPLDWAAAGKVLKIESGSEVDAPYNTKWIRTEGIVSDANRGGPLLRGDGKVVGLCTSAGRRGKGPCLSVPVSKIRDLLARENYGISSLYPNPKGGFTWPESIAKKTEVFSYSRIKAAALGLKKSIECSKCEGHGYVITQQYQVDPATGARTRIADKQEMCDECGGAGVVIKPSIHELVSSLSRQLLNPDSKVTDAEKAEVKSLAEQAFDRVAINRLVLANCLTPFASKILEDPEKNRDGAVTFVAQAGPRMRWWGREYQWVLAYESNTWILTYGADVRTARSSTTVMPRDPRGRPMGAPSGTGRYVLVSGILEGYGTIESNKNVYTAPLLRAADIATLR